MTNKMKSKADPAKGSELDNANRSQDQEHSEPQNGEKAKAVSSGASTTRTVKKADTAKLFEECPKYKEQRLLEQRRIWRARRTRPSRRRFYIPPGG